MTIEIKKTFAKRETEKSEGGEIATVTLATPDKAFEGWTWEGKEIPAASVKAIVATYFFQSMSDAYAGETKLEAAKGLFNGKVDAMMNGTIGVRSSSGVDALTKIMRQFARQAYKASVSADEYKETYTDAETDAQNVILDAIVEANRKKLEPLAKAEQEKRKAEAEASAKLAASITVDVN